MSTPYFSLYFSTFSILFWDVIVLFMHVNPAHMLCDVGLMNLPSGGNMKIFIAIRVLEKKWEI